MEKSKINTVSNHIIAMLKVEDGKLANAEDTQETKPHVRNVSLQRQNIYMHKEVTWSNVMMQELHYAFAKHVHLQHNTRCGCHPNYSIHERQRRTAIHPPAPTDTSPRCWRCRGIRSAPKLQHCLAKTLQTQTSLQWKDSSKNKSYRAKQLQS